ncbi:hypothetical protein PR048_005718 [Dryococelus australis]|uniref:Uncharacterized protein n=1 Tax=Dryococelus australis TaxID=614101 RepID=A0ABQ9I906_9NEOP|nr:hypothetical protein PR048_005718 [Dryococelus australis]
MWGGGEVAISYDTHPSLVVTEGTRKARRYTQKILRPCALHFLVAYSLTTPYSSIIMPGLTQHGKVSRHLSHRERLRPHWTATSASDNFGGFERSVSPAVAGSSLGEQSTSVCLHVRPYRRLYPCYGSSNTILNESCELVSCTVCRGSYFFMALCTFGEIFGETRSLPSYPSYPLSHSPPSLQFSSINRGVCLPLPLLLLQLQLVVDMGQISCGQQLRSSATEMRILGREQWRTIMKEEARRSLKKIPPAKCNVRHVSHVLKSGCDYSSGNRTWFAVLGEGEKPKSNGKANNKGNEEGNELVRKLFVTLKRRKKMRVLWASACLPPRRTGLNPRPGHSRIFACGNRTWTIPLVGRFSQGSPISLALSFRRCSILISTTRVTSQDVAVKSQRNIFTHSLRRKYETFRNKPILRGQP